MKNVLLILALAVCASPALADQHDPIACGNAIWQNVLVGSGNIQNLQLFASRCEMPVPFTIVSLSAQVYVASGNIDILFYNGDGTGASPAPPETVNCHTGLISAGSGSGTVTSTAGCNHSTTQTAGVYYPGINADNSTFQVVRAPGNGQRGVLRYYETSVTAGTVPALSPQPPTSQTTFGQFAAWANLQPVGYDVSGWPAPMDDLQSGGNVAYDIGCEPFTVARDGTAAYANWFSPGWSSGSGGNGNIAVFAADNGLIGDPISGTWQYPGTMLGSGTPVASATSSWTPWQALSPVSSGTLHLTTGTQYYLCVDQDFSDSASGLCSDNTTCASSTLLQPWYVYSHGNTNLSFGNFPAPGMTHGPLFNGADRLLNEVLIQPDPAPLRRQVAVVNSQ